VFTDWEHGQERHFRTRVNKDFVFEMNKRMAWNAERAVLSAIRDPTITVLVDEAKATVGQPKLDRRSFGALISKRIGAALSATIAGGPKLVSTWPPASPNDAVQPGGGIDHGLRATIARRWIPWRLSS